MFTTFKSIQQNKVISLTPKNSGNKMENGYWQRWVLETTCKKFFCIVSSKNIKSCQSPKKKKKCINCKVVCQLTHLSLKIIPNGTPFDIIFIDPPIFNRWIFHGVLNSFWWKDSISATYSGIGGIHTTNLSQRISGQWKGILRFIVDDHTSPYNNNMMITSMCSHY